MEHLYAAWGMHYSWDGLSLTGRWEATAEPGRGRQAGLLYILVQVRKEKAGKKRRQGRAQAGRLWEVEGWRKEDGAWRQAFSGPDCLSEAVVEDIGRWRWAGRQEG